MPSLVVYEGLLSRIEECHYVTVTNAPEMIVRGTSANSHANGGAPGLYALACSLPRGKYEVQTLRPRHRHQSEQRRCGRTDMISLVPGVGRATTLFAISHRSRFESFSYFLPRSSPAVSGEEELGGNSEPIWVSSYT